MMDTFKVGDMGILIRTYNPACRVYLGHCYTVVGPLEMHDNVLAHLIEPVPAGYTYAICTPDCLLKINPPPDFVNEQERDELTA